MAQSFSNAKLVSALVTKAINRRGFSAAAAAAPKTATARSAGASMVKKSGEEIVGSTTEKVSWIPDPRTGCYRPADMTKEIDAAELRAMLLKKH